MFTPANISYLITIGRIKKIWETDQHKSLKRILVEYYKDKKKSRQENGKEN